MSKNFSVEMEYLLKTTSLSFGTNLRSVRLGFPSKMFDTFPNFNGYPSYSRFTKLLLAPSSLKDPKALNFLGGMMRLSPLCLLFSVMYLSFTCCCSLVCFKKCVPYLDIMVFGLFLG